ncbi:unnamed protein product [Cladocopium goreaui]|uniref:Serine/threonine-protein phosphatase PP1-2 n=1 Tax=Cladocopium goreaui TaxID=2562237 RepID=A0A9P1BS46_9DINO|nr:unnamed protein product [Cladocopium goreaui]
MASAVNESAEVNVSVLNLAGDVVATWRGAVETSIQTVKREVAKRGGPPPACQVLSLEENHLKDEETFRDLKCTGDLTLTLVTTGGLNVWKLINTLMDPKGGPEYLQDIAEEDLLRLCELSSRVFLSEAPVLHVPDGVVVFGSLSGEFHQLRHIFATCGDVLTTRYVGLGNYCNRGEHGIETLGLLFSYKCMFPENFILLRGKHVCVVQNRVLCVCSGLSCEHGFDFLQRLERPTDIPDEGFLCDLLWAEPDLHIAGFSDSIRDGNKFGPDVVQNFLRANNFEMMCRTAVVDEGFEWFGDTKLVTIISVANYAGEFNNKGAVMLIDDNGNATFSVFESGAAPKAPRQRSLSPSSAPAALAPLAKDAAG